MPYYWNWTRYTAVMPLFNARELLLPDPEWIARGGYFNERNDKVREGLTAYIRAQVKGRQDLIDKLVPTYAPMARRPVVDNNWYKSLTRDNVELVTEPIERLTVDGIRTVDGQTRKADLIVAAVGFQTARYLHPAVYRGIGGVTLDEEWADGGPRAHIGMTVPGFPNFFMLYGPNSQPVSGGSALPVWFEIWSAYIARLLIAMLEGGHRRIEVKREAYEAYNQRLDDTANGMIYVLDPGSRDDNYYVHRGRLLVNAPWEGDEYYAISAQPDLDEFNFS
jgi:4-hydroxyacetophenone monooxygenase